MTNTKWQFLLTLQSCDIWSKFLLLFIAPFDCYMATASLIIASVIKTRKR